MKTPNEPRLLQALPDPMGEAVFILDAEGCFMDYLTSLNEEFLTSNPDLRGR